MTTWTGGETGTDSLSSGKTSLWYTKVVGEVPAVVTPVTNYPTPGYHEIGMVHETVVTFKSGSLKVYINGSEVEIDEIGGDQFELVSDIDGYIMVEYLPYQQLYYIGKNLPQTNYSHALAPLLKSHLTELIVAINSAEEDLHLEKTLWPIGRLGGLSETAEVTSSTIQDKALFIKIQSAVNYMRYVLQNTYRRYVLGDNLSAPIDIIDPEFIIAARIQINAIETVIASL